MRGIRLYALTVIEHSSRRIRVLGTTAYPTTPLGGILNEYHQAA